MADKFSARFEVLDNAMDDWCHINIPVYSLNHKFGRAQESTHIADISNAIKFLLDRGMIALEFGPYNADIRETVSFSEADVFLNEPAYWTIPPPDKPGLYLLITPEGERIASLPKEDWERILREE